GGRHARGSRLVEALEWDWRRDNYSASNYRQECAHRRKRENIERGRRRKCRWAGRELLYSRSNCDYSQERINSGRNGGMKKRDRTRALEFCRFSNYRLAQAALKLSQKVPLNSFFKTGGFCCCPGCVWAWAFVFAPCWKT